jgi:hypothetical protein
MATEKVGFFDEKKKGVRSSTRLNSFILLFFMMGFNILLSQTEGFKIDSSFIVFNFLLLIGIFAPKYLHKIAESKLSDI